MAIFFFLLQGIKLSQPPPRARRGIHSTIKPPPAGLEPPTSLSLGSGPCTSSPGGWMKWGCDAKSQPTSCRGDGTRGHHVPSSQNREVLSSQG